MNKATHSCLFVMAPFSAPAVVALRWATIVLAVASAAAGRQKQLPARSLSLVPAATGREDTSAAAHDGVPLRAAQCSMRVFPGHACTSQAEAHMLGYGNATSAGACCRACLQRTGCRAWTFHVGSSCLLAGKASFPGVEAKATCGSIDPLPTTMPIPTSPPLPPLPPIPERLMVPRLTLARKLLFTDPAGFLRDPSSPIQDNVGVWHVWVVFVPPQ